MCRPMRIPFILTIPRNTDFSLLFLSFVVRLVCKFLPGNRVLPPKWYTSRVFRPLLSVGNVYCYSITNTREMEDCNNMLAMRSWGMDLWILLSIISRPWNWKLQEYSGIAGAGLLSARLSFDVIASRSSRVFAIIFFQQILERVNRLVCLFSVYIVIYFLLLPSLRLYALELWNSVIMFIRFFFLNE